MGRILWTCVLALLLTACDPDAPDQGKRETDEARPGVRLVTAEAERVRAPDVTDARVADLVRSNNDFAFDMYDAAGRAGEGNMIFSPYSISTALAMTSAGARGETEKQMRQVLHFGIPQAQVHPAFSQLQRQLVEAGRVLGIRLLDHLIVNPAGQFLSLAERGAL